MIYVFESEKESKADMKSNLENIVNHKDIMFISKFEEVNKLCTKEDVIFVDADSNEGLVFARKIKEAVEGINIIFISKDLKAVNEANSLFASGYIVKPVTKDKLAKQFMNLRCYNC